MKKRLLLWALSSSLLLGGPALAREVTLDAHVFGGGGGTSSADAYSLTGTIGQTAVGHAADGSYQLQSGFWSFALEVVVEPVESFQSWMENLPPEQKPPEGQRGPADEPAGDGMSNLLKYALGLMPMAPARDAAPVIQVNGGHIDLELERSISAAVDLQLEGSTDLATWVEVPFAETILSSGSGSGRERIRLLTGLAAADHSHYFLRLRVSKR